MDSINITIPSERFETMVITLSSEEVATLFKTRKEQAEQIIKLTKDLKTKTEYYDATIEASELKSTEIAQANALLTALGITEKTTEEEIYRRKPLSIATRIALYIATNR